MNEETRDMREDLQREIAQLKEAVRFLLQLIGETIDLNPHADEIYEKLIIKLDVNV